MSDEDFNMQDVVSSQIAAVGYDPATQRLRIRFVYGDSLYEYSGVPLGVYDGLMGAPSIGSYFDAAVKKAGFSYVRLS